MLCPCSSVESLHGRQSMNFSNMTPSHGMQFFTNCSSVGPPRGHKPCQKTCSSVGSSLQGSAGAAKSLLQRRIFTGSKPASGIHLLWCGVTSTGYWWISAHLGPPWAATWQPVPPWSAPWAVRESLLWCLKHLLPPTPSALTLVSAELFLPHILPPLSPCRFFLPP